jgi:hypothetical protein
MGGLGRAGCAGEHGYYSTRVWKTIILDRRWLQLQNPDTPPGDDYYIMLGMYSLTTNERVPITVNGQPAGTVFIAGRISR